MSTDKRKIALISFSQDADSIFACKSDRVAFSESGNKVFVPTEAESINSETQCIEFFNKLINQIDTDEFDIALVYKVRPRLATLQEMQRVLSIIDKHAVVSPRLSNSRFCSFPNMHEALDIDIVEETARKILPPFSRIPAASHHLALFRGEALANVDPLDISYKTIKGAIEDLCLRMNIFGFDSIVANHAFESAPLEDIDAIDETRINEQHEYFASLRDYFFEFGIDASCQFFDLMVPDRYRRPKLLFEFSGMLPFHCGTTEYQIALLEYFFELFSDKYDIDIYLNHEADDFHHIRERFGHVRYVGEQLGTYHIGLFAAQPVKIETQLILNRHCLKTVYTMLDAIMLRCHYIAIADAWKGEDIIRLALESSDGIIAISDFSRNDYRNYFIASKEIWEKSSLSVYIATDFGKHATSNEEFPELPFNRYTLIVGNSFRHKALRETVNAIADTSRNYIVVGWNDEGLIQENIYAYPTTKLPEAFLDFLYEKCDNFVFPSLYEGFGLPIVIAIKHGKKVIVNDNELNRELFVHYPELQNYFSFFQQFSQIPDCLDAISSAPTLPKDTYNHSWKDAVIEIEQYLYKLLGQSVDIERLERRWRTANLIQNQMREASESVGLKIALRRRLSRKKD